MKNCTIFLLIAFCLKLSHCLAQNQTTLYDKDGMVLSYKKGKYFGERYDEYCKTTFDIYKVIGFVENKNQDKAAFVVAVLGFEGKTCNKIYNDNGPSGGEIIDKIYTLDIPGQTTHKSQYWVNRVVHLLPGEKMEATGYVEVKKGDPCPDAESSPYFTYELISEANKVNNNKGDEVTESKAVESESKYRSFILGTWKFVRKSYHDENDKEIVETDISNVYQIQSDGKCIQLFEGKRYDNIWELSGNELRIKYQDGNTAYYEILEINEKKMILQGASESVMGFIINTFIKQ